MAERADGLEAVRDFRARAHFEVIVFRKICEKIKRCGRTFYVKDFGLVRFRRSIGTDGANFFY
jgi:hypothetical protein